MRKTQAEFFTMYSIFSSGVASFGIFWQVQLLRPLPAWHTYRKIRATEVGVETDGVDFDTQEGHSPHADAHESEGGQGGL